LGMTTMFFAATPSSISVRRRCSAATSTPLQKTVVEVPLLHHRRHQSTQV
jgi:hypothetical protein